MDHVSNVSYVTIQININSRTETWQQKRVEIWIIFMQIECINKSLVAFNSIDDIFM